MLSSRSAASHRSWAKESLTQIGPEDTLHGAIPPHQSDAEAAAEEALGLTRLVEIGVQHAHVVQDPRHRLVIGDFFEGLEGGVIVGRSPREIAADVGEHAEILLDHAVEADLTGLGSQPLRPAVQLDGVVHLPAPLGDDCSAVHGRRLGRRFADLVGYRDATRVQDIRPLDVTQVP